jgi:hypothetical protein
MVCVTRIFGRVDFQHCDWLKCPVITAHKRFDLAQHGLDSEDARSRTTSIIMKRASGVRDEIRGFSLEWACAYGYKLVRSYKKLKTKIESNPSARSFRVDFGVG